MKACPHCKQRYPDESGFCYADGNTLEPMADSRLGSAIGNRFVLEEVLGAGRFGTVYRGREQFTGTRVAVKVFGGGSQAASVGLQTPAVKEQLRRAGALTQRLVHPNIALLLDEGESEDREVYFVSELVEAPTLSKHLRGGKLTLARSLNITVQIARALSRAHDFAAPHGDVRPTNIFVHKNDRAQLYDFGIARSHELFRAPAYCAPEQLGPYADLYSLGVVLYEMLTGSLPYLAPDREAMANKHKNDPIPRAAEKVPSVPQPVDDLLQSLMAKTPMGRPVDAHALVARIQSIAEELRIELAPAPDLEAKLPPLARDADHGTKVWETRVAIFDEMVKKSFAASSPPHIGKMMDDMGKKVREMTDVRGNALRSIEQMEIIDGESRDGLARLGQAMSTVMQEASRLRQEVRALQGAIGQDLAAQLADIDFQVKDLRSGTEAHVTDWKERRGQPVTELAELGRRWNELEFDLLSVAARLCAPLRARPELHSLFSKLG